MPAAARRRGIRLHAGHSEATLAEVEASLEWGVAHVDHLFCAMSVLDGQLRVERVFLQGREIDL